MSRAVRGESGLFGAVVRPLQEFLAAEAAGGILLLGCAVIALLWANLSPDSYSAVLRFPLVLGAGSIAAHFEVQQFINDGLMTVFFFVVGMEIKRELVVGELNSVGKAMLPAIAALGGMVLPAAIYLAFNHGGPGAAGWGIPMATDIAFCVGILTLLKDRVPRALVVFITALAIFDDIGGIVVIALFYGHGLNVPWLLAALAVTFVLFAMNRADVVRGLPYALAGGALWFALHHGGIHATISGVILGLAIPARPSRAPRKVLHELADHAIALDSAPSDEDLDGAAILAIEEKLEELQAPLDRFVHGLHRVVAFMIMPLFALANSGVALPAGGLRAIAAPVAAGTAAALFVGKQLGIFVPTLLAVKLGVAPMPGGASKVKLFGVAIVAGIGFTVALFIAALAFPDSRDLLDQAKLGILLGSLVAGVVGYAVVRSAA